MGFWTLFEVATMPILQVLLISCLGAFLASGYSNILHADARKYMNKVVFIVFTPSLTFASLAKTVTLEEIISWWFMPVNIGLIFLFGGILGWIVVKILKPERHLQGLVIATCSAGNLGNLLLIVIPAICNEKGSPFGEPSICGLNGIAFSSFSMALSGIYVWTYIFHLIKTSSQLFHQQPSIEEARRVPNKEIDSGADAQLLKNENRGPVSENKAKEKGNLKGVLHQVVDVFMAPPTIGAIWGFIFGTVPWLKSLLIGSNAPLRVIHDSIKLLGDGTIPCITLILGGNLTQGLQSGRLKPSVIFAIVVVRYMILPAIGIVVVRTANQLGFLSANPLYQYVLMVQFTVPPAMNISTMTQLFDVGQDECSVVYLWTYLVAALALTVWSTFYMWILT
ncbi:protein PIN-LIKES 7-like isoform X1 [Aristolochia californica]|uniref:protein PIN-LIKES 7-like isoform X1 n=1 Tax=Aristolochia californica TaxID=171875 RepID=UPI0035D9F05D